MMVEIIVEVLDILGTATKEMKQSRASEADLQFPLFEAHDSRRLEKFLKRVAGITKLDEGLKRLDKMTNEEARMANAELMRMAHNIDTKVEGVDRRVRGADENVKLVEKKVQMIIDGAQTMFDQYSISSLTFNLLEGKEVATGANLTMQQTANDVDDVKRS